MKRIVILAYDFPPYVSVGGLRPYSWYKYLSEYDVYPVVITRQWGNNYGSLYDYVAPGVSNQSVIETTDQGTIIRAPYFPTISNKLLIKYGDSKFRLIRKLVSAFYEMGQWLFLMGPKVPLYFAAKKYMQKNNIDVIIATGDPFILFKYASKLSKLYNIPWIADYRDPWTQDKHIQGNFFIKKFIPYFEKRILSNASLITTVSEFFKIQILKRVSDKSINIVPNGFDHESTDNLNKVNQQSGELHIGFAGTIYKWHPIHSVLSVISAFLSEHPDAKVVINFYGINIIGELNALLATHFPNLSRNIFIYPKLQNPLLLRELAKCNLLLLFNDYSIGGTKIFDYLAVKRTILLCYTNDKHALALKEKHFCLKEDVGDSPRIQEEIVKENSAGFLVQDAVHLRSLLEKLYNEFTRNGSIKCNAGSIEKYSRKLQAEKLAGIIKSIVR